jgi:threonine 3-dehydrogenase
MKALVKTKPEKGLSLQEVEKPTVGPNDVLIKIKKVSICGTDIHIYDWDEWAQTYVPTPLIVGHEFMGEIAAIGKEVDPDYVKIGDRVSGENHIACGHCRNCRSTFSHLCRRNISVGVTRHGCFADYLCIPAANAYPVPDAISDELAAILNPFGNSTQTALTYNLIGEDVLITGAGPVGIMAAAIARHSGARHVVITDINEYRLKLAEKMGASLAVNVNKTSLREVMQQLDMKEGFDVGLEMSGHAPAFNEMITYINHAGKIALLGFLPKKTQVDWSEIIMKGLTIKGIYGREMYDTWYKMISMLQSGLDITPIITHEYSINEFQKAFDTMRSGQAGKIILNWDY